MRADDQQVADVTMYTLSLCPYCWRARRRLLSKGVVYEEIRFTRREQRDGRKVIAELGGRTFPQIIINGNRLGGNAELVKADRSGELDRLLWPRSPAHQGAGRLTAT